MHYPESPKVNSLRRQAKFFLDISTLSKVLIAGGHCISPGEGNL